MVSDADTTVHKTTAPVSEKTRLDSGVILPTGLMESYLNKDKTSPFLTHGNSLSTLLFQNSTTLKLMVS
jgi:hypothetical protein